MRHASREGPKGGTGFLLFDPGSLQLPARNLLTSYFWSALHHLIIFFYTKDNCPYTHQRCIKKNK